MKQLVVISGKGGTGKTVISASFAALERNAVVVDCDVDAADMHLLLQVKNIETGEFKAGEKNGRGTMIYPDGRKQEGEFKNGEFVGQ